MFRVIIGGFGAEIFVTRVLGVGIIFVEFGFIVCEGMFGVLGLGFYGSLSPSSAVTKIKQVPLTCSPLQIELTHDLQSQKK